METKALRITPYFSELLARSQAANSKNIKIAWLTIDIIPNKWNI